MKMRKVKRTCDGSVDEKRDQKYDEKVRIKLNV